MGKGRRRGEKHQCVVASCTPPTGDLACNPGICPDREMDCQSFGLQVCRPVLKPLRHTSQGSNFDKNLNVINRMAKFREIFFIPFNIQLGK